MRTRTKLLFLVIIIGLGSCNSSETKGPENQEISMEPIKEFILDADTGNEMDDLYAIVRCLIDDEVKLLSFGREEDKIAALCQHSAGGSQGDK